MGDSERTETVSLDEARSRKFLHKLAEDSHLTIFVSTDGEVSIWSKGIEPAQLERIKDVLQEVQTEHEG